MSEGLNSDDAVQADGSEAQQENVTTRVFLCYRRADGRNQAEWLHKHLRDADDAIADGGQRRLDIYFDQTAPGVDDWKQFHFPHLQSSKALILVCTPGLATDLSRKGEPDWVYRELRWWTGHRAAAPIVIDATGEGNRWLPDLINRKWPNLNRILFDLDEANRSEAAGDTSYAARVCDRIFATIRESERATVFEDLERFRKLTKRLVLALAVAVLGVALALSFANIARQQRDLADLRYETAEETTRLMTDMFAQADPDQTYGESLTAGQLLRVGTANIEKSSNPRLKARLLQAMGSAYTGLGLVEKSIRLLTDAEKLLAYEETPAKERFGLNLALGEVYLYAEDYSTASKYLAEAKKLGARTHKVPHENLSAVLVAEGDLQAWPSDGDLDKARKSYNEALDIDTSLGKSLLIARDKNRLGFVAFYEGNLEQAGRMFSEARDTAVAAGARLPAAENKNDLAAVQFEVGDFAGAEQAYRAARDTFIDVYGPDHGAVASVENNLARILIERGELDEAGALLEHAKETLERSFGNAFRELGFTLNNLGFVRMIGGGDATARDLLFDAERIAEQGGLPILPQTRVHIGETYLDEDDLIHAEEWLTKAQSAFGGIDTGWRYAILQSALGELSARQCNLDEAESLLSKSRTSLNKRWTVDNPFKAKLTIRENLLEQLRGEGSCQQ